MRPTVGIIDWDACIQDISIPWYRNALLNKDVFDPYLNLNEDYSIDQMKDLLFNRSEYEIMHCLLKEGINKGDIPKEVIDDFYRLYTDDPDFYIKCPLLSGYRIVKSLLMQESNTRSITFLSHYINKAEAKKKLERFNRIFKPFHKNTKFVGIPGSTKKSQWINEHLPNWNLIMDDAPHVLLDILNNCDCKNRTIIYPIYGYNKSFEKSNNDLIAKSEVELASFKPSIIGIIK